MQAKHFGAILHPVKGAESLLKERKRKLYTKITQTCMQYMYMSYGIFSLSFTEPYVQWHHWLDQIWS